MLSLPVESSSVATAVLAYRIALAAGLIAAFTGVASAQGAIQTAPVSLEIDIEAADDDSTPGSRLAASATSGNLLLIEKGSSVVLAASLATRPPNLPNRPFVLANPESQVPAVVTQSRKTDLRWTADSGGLEVLDNGRVRWIPGKDGQLATVSVELETTESASAQRSSEQAPALREVTEQGRQSVRLLPAVPYDRDGDGTIAGVYVGIYPNEYDENAPAPVQRNAAAYSPPESFYRLDETTSVLPLTGTATWGDLVPEILPAEGARFVPFDPDLVALWAGLRNEIQQAGHSNPAHLTVLRGSMTPHERRRLERLGVELAEYTRFQYGDALAVIMDSDGNYRMDDLDGDGEVDSADAEVLAEYVSEAMGKSDLQGGLGIESSFEGPNHIGTPYVHVDLRGWDVRWSN